MQAARTNKERLVIPDIVTAASLWKNSETCTVTYTVAHQLNYMSFVIMAKLADAADLKADASYLISLSK
jgi:hypothetical protein